MSHRCIPPPLLSISLSLSLSLHLLLSFSSRTGIASHFQFNQFRSGSIVLYIQILGEAPHWILRGLYESRPDCVATRLTTNPGKPGLIAIEKLNP